MWDPEKGAAHQAGYEPFVSSIATHTTAFGKPVLMLNGDSHVYRRTTRSSPARPATHFIHPGYDVPNFHRIVVHGSTVPLEWLSSRSTGRATAAPGAGRSGRSAGRG